MSHTYSNFVLSNAVASIVRPMRESIHHVITSSSATTSATVNESKEDRRKRMKREVAKRLRNAKKLEKLATSNAEQL